MPADINIAEFIKESFPELWMNAGSKQIVINGLNELPLTGFQRVDIMIQWLEAFDMKMTGAIAKELGA